MSTSITVGDLPRQIGTQGTPRPFLLCQSCGEEYSAEKWDYLMLPDDHVLTCRDAPMRLVIKRTEFVEVQS